MRPPSKRLMHFLDMQLIISRVNKHQPGEFSGQLLFSLILIRATDKRTTAGRL